MRLKYVGPRKSVNIVCSGRATYYFGPENDYVLEVPDMKHVTQILKSVLHRFEVVAPEKVKAPKAPEAPKAEPPKEEKPKKGRGGKKGKK